eukprot:TRINITY_DN74171_c0_g1_i1.p1 TRINITY_DN74171_c0_g1~~TRINITY_DN74171_c0_g1_i1.p1  ORF type:complete len:230 (+),score=30.51 TRINITY_DN74171_c0_g1_i1:204-893(+)
MILRCPCGAVRAEKKQHVAMRTGGGLVCHCSMCSSSERRSAFYGGVPWVSLPRLTFEGAVRVRRDSSWAARGSCASCSKEIFMHYDCEPNTGWIHADLVGVSTPHDPLVIQGSGLGESMMMWGHIFCDKPVSDGVRASVDFALWEENKDPCRPTGVPAPHVCASCFQTRDACGCQDDKCSSALKRHLCEHDDAKGCELEPKRRRWCWPCRNRLGDEALEAASAASGVET